MGPAFAALCAIRISVFGLFHPQVLEVRPAAGELLLLEVGSEKVVVESSESAQINARGNAVEYVVRGRKADAPLIRISARDGGAARLILAVPERIKRRFQGRLEIKSVRGSLTALLETDLETAAASVVVAESAPAASIEALKAQAVAARSYFLAARGRHGGFDFCDTTHCQFLRQPPEATDVALVATLQTRGLVLAYQGVPIAALYSASCGGRTLSLAEVGFESDGYPYFSVVCMACRYEARQWESRLDLPAIGGSETWRLRVGRTLGWAVVPGNNHEVMRTGADVIIRGRGAGHGVGLCQRGAKAMAASGASFERILSYYYPNTSLLLRER